jgi:thioredoxin
MPLDLKVEARSMSRILELDNTSFDSALKQSRKILVDFWAPWCRPCRQMDPIMERISKKFDSMVFARVNIEEYKDIATRYHISSLPAFVVFRDAKPSQSRIGTISEQALEEFVSFNAR